MDAKQHWLSLDALLEALAARGFVLGTDTHLRLVAFLEQAGHKPFAELETLKYQLAALLCRSADQQTEFYALFSQFLVEMAVTLEEEKAEPDADASTQTTTNNTPAPAPEVNPNPAPTAETPLAPPKAPDSKLTRSGIPIAGKSGPIRLELRFPGNPMRPWNTAPMDRALRPLLEKEWANTQEWNIPATIRRSIQNGGFLHLETKRRKRAPQYLLLIDQRGPRDHLAGLYAELAAEMNRRDMAAEHYYYNFRPWRCWKDFRDLRTHTDIETLQNTYAGYKLLIVGEPDGLLDLPALRPSNLAVDLREHWSQTALLCTKPTSAWGNAELALCQLFPVVPAAAEGLATLHAQWNATEVLSPAWWRAAWPELALPDFSAEGIKTAEDMDKQLKHYLGREGYYWLCAAAVYPELYWELTALLHDESIPPQAGASEWDLNQSWQIALLRLSRLSWFREGRIPAASRALLLAYFNQKMPPVQRSAVRLQLLQVLGMTENHPPDGSWAAAERAYTLVTLDDAHTEDQSTLAGADTGAVQQRAWAREAEALAQAQGGVSQAALEEAIGRKLQLEAVGLPDAPEQSAENTPAYEPPYVAFVTSNQLNVHKGPGTTFDTVGVLEKNARIFVSEVSGEWLRIGRERWVNQADVDGQQVLHPEDWITRATVTPVFSMLWVDDKPDPNRNLRKTLADALGVRSLTCGRTVEALDLLKESHIDLIVSDTTREGSPWAGIDMFQEFRALGIQTPWIASTSADKASQYESDIVETGALGVFSRENSMRGLVEELVREKEGRFGKTPAPTQTRRFHLLWVDDYPDNNTYLVEAIEAKHASVAVTAVPSTEAALLELDKMPYQAVISDLGRGDNDLAGLELLEKLRENNKQLPFAIFASARVLDYQAQLLEAGAQISTHDEKELLAWVTAVVTSWKEENLKPPPPPDVEQTAQSYAPPRLVLDPAKVPAQPLRVFIGYAHRNSEYIEPILGFLRGLQERKYIDIWQDQQMEAGQNWQEEINRQLNAADVVLFLVTPHLLNSEASMEFEFKRALQRAQNRELRIIPVLVEPCDWQETVLKDWFVFPSTGEALVNRTRSGEGLNWSGLEALLYNLACSKKEQWTWPGSSGSVDGPSTVLQPGMRLQNRYELKTLIGRGGYGDIWQAVSLLDNAQVALKIITNGNKTLMDSLRREYELVGWLEHPNIIRYISFETLDGRACLAMPFYTKGALQGHKGQLTELELWRILADIALALAYLHQRSPANLHCDVTPANILIGDNDNYILSDFGISRIVGEAAAPQGMTAPGYRAPEYLRVAETPTPHLPEIDVWALGVTLYELATGKLPFEGRGGANFSEPVSLPERFSKEVGKLIETCLAVRPEARPTAEALAREAGAHLAQAQKQAPEAAASNFEVPLYAPNPPVLKTTQKGAPKKERTIFQRLFGLGKEEEIDPSVLPEMIFVKGGTFQMGEEGVATPVHPVTLSDFEMGKYPVTQKLWMEIMGDNPSHFKEDDLPVVSVKWEEVQEFLKKLNIRYPGKNYRLPTEAEWEFAARGGTLSKGYTYAGSNDLNEVGWFWENSGDQPLSGEWKAEKLTKNNCRTRPVGQKKANELGIHDMSGNVWEWCADWYGEYKDTKQPIYNPTGPSVDYLRVNRGGSSSNESTGCRVANRSRWNPRYRGITIGFRLARTY